MNNSRDTPDLAKYGGPRKSANIRDNIAALREWTARRNAKDSHGESLAVRVKSDAVVLLELHDLNLLEVARFPLRDGYWGLQWMRGNGTWQDYEPGGKYLTLAIPMLLIDEDVDGRFWA